MKSFKFEDKIYKHQVQIPIRYMDLDLMGHVNNARYLNFLEEARLSYAKEVLKLYTNISELSVVVARIEIDFLTPLFYGQTLMVWTRLDKMGKKSFRFTSLIGIPNEEDFSLVSKAEQSMVFYNKEKKKSIPIPEVIKNKVLAYEE